MRKTAFILYLLFVGSWFLHTGSRMEALATIRFDLLLVLGIVGLLLMSSDEHDRADQLEDGPDHSARTRKLILTLVVYSIVTLPFVQWPGTVLNAGLPDYVKALVFFFFTAKLVTTPVRLKWFLAVFVAAMTFRVLEPLYLHVTTGYWGSYASMAGGEALDRLSGAPHDVINPNGLAFVILTVLPFFHFLGPLTWLGGTLYLAVLPMLIWALILTGSRSGMLGLAMVVLSIWWKSRHKVLLAATVAIAVIGIIPLLPPDLADRYLSIASSNTKNAATAEGRLSGLETDFRVALRRPFFGHGLGTSLEANANFARNDAPTHNLYLETAQELGFFGVIILVALLVSIVRNLRASLQELQATGTASPLMLRLTNAVQVWLAMNILFSFASYGLRSYEWYLAAGFSDILYRAARELRQQQASGPIHVTKTHRRHPMLDGVLGDASAARVALWPDRLADTLSTKPSAERYG